MLRYFTALAASIVIFSQAWCASPENSLFLYEIQSTNRLAPPVAEKPLPPFATLKSVASIPVPEASYYIPSNSSQLSSIPFEFNKSCCGYDIGCGVCGNCGCSAVSACGCYGYANDCCCYDCLDSCCCECDEGGYGVGSGAGIGGSGATGYYTSIGGVGGAGTITGDDDTTGDEATTTDGTTTTTTTTTDTNVIIPEPSTYLMLGAALLMALLIQLARKRAHK